MHAFLINLAHRQTDRQTDMAKTFTSSFVGSNNLYFTFNEVSRVKFTSAKLTDTYTIV